jgi:hypothetical protein
MRRDAMHDERYGRSRRLKLSHRARTIAVLAATSLGASSIATAGDLSIGDIGPGMNQTELQSVLGPPDYIQYNGPRQAWQYCPHFIERLLRKRGDIVEDVERLIARQDSKSGDFFITVWFTEGQVEHMRAYPEEAMGSCVDFYRAFRWEDNLEGAFFEIRRWGK